MHSSQQMGLKRKAGLHLGEPDISSAAYKKEEDFNSQLDQESRLGSKKAVRLELKKEGQGWGGLWDLGRHRESKRSWERNGCGLWQPQNCTFPHSPTYPIPPSFLPPLHSLLSRSQPIPQEVTFGHSSSRNQLKQSN